MTKLSIEVKTLYVVQIDFLEWWTLFRKDEDETIDNAKKRFKAFPICCTGMEMQRLAKAGGFDGWENAGYYNDRINKLVCTFYDNGNRIE